MTVPTGTEVKLSDIVLEEGFTWKDSSLVVNENGYFKAIYIKDNSGNYKEVEVDIYITLNYIEEPTDDSSSKKGCKGSIVASIFGVLALAGSVTILRKKRQY